MSSVTCFKYSFVCILARAGQKLKRRSRRGGSVPIIPATGNLKPSSSHHEHGQMDGDTHNLKKKKRQIKKKKKKQISRRGLTSPYLGKPGLEKPKLT